MVNESVTQGGGMHDVFFYVTMSDVFANCASLSGLRRPYIILCHMYVSLFKVHS